MNKFIRRFPMSPLQTPRTFNTFGAAGLPVVLAVPLVSFGSLALHSYGWTLFILLPSLVGALSTCLFVRNDPQRSFAQSAGVATVSLLLVGAGLLLLGIEGAVCLLMAFPLALPLALLGAWLAWLLRRWIRAHRASPPVLTCLLPSAFLLLGAEAAVPREAPIYAVRSAVVIDAAPETVWKNVVSFGRLPAPDGWLFRTGIAYPIRAEIRGTGVGAVRRCHFSTGPFVEPIEVWDEPRLLRFAVTANPPALEETSPWGAIHPPHVEGFLVSKRGQFRLTGLSGGRTLLEGTTWYQHGLYPAGYWRLWSDWIIHRIHLQVLEHVKRLSEGEKTQALAL
jgi:hypothetical protein